jgi:hypothetical protein
MQGNRRPYYRTIKGKPTHLKPKIVMKEIHGQVVPVKVYPAQYAKDISDTSRYKHRDLGDPGARKVFAKRRSVARFGAPHPKKRVDDPDKQR